MARQKHETADVADVGRCFCALERALSRTRHQWTSPAPNDNRKVAEIKLITREGWLYAGLDLETFRKLKRKRAISSRKGQPYGVTRRGLELVRSQLDNR